MRFSGLRSRYAMSFEPRTAAERSSVGYSERF
jgi:hypothetical protein